MDFKQLGTGVLLLILLGIAGFLYRNALTRPVGIGATACTLEAKMCPDGTAVGRGGPDCAFAPCPPPNVSLDALGVAFALPASLSAVVSAPANDAAVVASYETATGTPPDTVTIRDYPIPAGKTADAVLLGETTLAPSGLAPASVSAFSKETLGTHTFFTVTVERFEGVIHTAYYLPRAKDVLRFDATDTDVTGWTDVNLDITGLPAQAALRTLLSTLQAGS
ncbi:MAG: hypothetical protein KGI41_02125 [Patescibacteria group bacterium]|nr:hypothetical protein [Patescibacteria group bacterium]MDE1966010.1 hypothetical protein [Patescibacteria group bacterium]